jgi:predicted glutamine amidotransferase
MCRLILAQGTFSSAQVLDAAVMMSCGRTANHDGPTQRHPNGWGAVWRDGDELAIHREVEPIEQSAARSPIGELSTRFLAIHVRHATLARNHGMQYTHPLRHAAPTRTWYLLHNGFLPTVHQRLGKAQSEFDSAEYLEYLLHDSADGLDVAKTEAKLAAIPPGGSSANAFLISHDRAYVIHWTPADTKHPVYFTMHRLETPDYSIIASEIIETLAPRQHWKPLPTRQIHELAI